MLRTGMAIMILELARQGVSVTEIARRTGHDRKTIRKCIARGMEPPTYTPRPKIGAKLDAFVPYLLGRLAAYPTLTGVRLMREIVERGYEGGRTRLKIWLREARPTPVVPFEVRFETDPGKQAQVDFAHFSATFESSPSAPTTVWLFSMVLGCSRMLWGRFGLRQDLPAVLAGHMDAFESFGGVPQEVLYDQMKTAVIGSADPQGGIAYNAKLLSLAKHYGFTPKSCRPYRAKTKGKVERPFRYIREDFFLGRTFRDLDDLNARFSEWLDTVANARTHRTTRRVVSEHFAEERPALRPLPQGRHADVLDLRRGVSRDGMISVQGSFYSVPNGARGRELDVRLTATTVELVDAGRTIAVHPRAEESGSRVMGDGHRRRAPDPGGDDDGKGKPAVPDLRSEGSVVPRALEVYDLVGRSLAGAGRSA